MAASEQERAQVGELCQAVQEVTGQNVKLAFADQDRQYGVMPCYTGKATQAGATAHGIESEIVKHTEAKKGFVVLPKRWVVEGCFAWTARCRRLAVVFGTNTRRDYERLPETLTGLHFAFFAGLMLVQASAKGLLASHLTGTSS